MENLPANFKSDLSNNKDFLNTILSDPKNKKDLFLFASDSSIELVLYIIHLVYTKTIKSPPNFFDEIRSKRKLKYISTRFSHEAFASLLKESRKKKIKTILFVWPILPDIISLLKKK